MSYEGPSVSVALGRKRFMLYTSPSESMLIVSVWMALYKGTMDGWMDDVLTVFPPQRVPL